ncbi:MAG: citrate (Si)-synthase [Chloroflexi bacterium]|nr:citrate (Si)-synthase [Chloroflexota bacterium]
MATGEITLHRGLSGVYFDRTETTFIDGKEGKLLYRGYNIHELAESSTFEETSFLLMYGELPTQTQLDEFDATLKANRNIPPEVTGIIRAVQGDHPMSVLRTAVSALSAFDPDAADNSSEATLRKGIRLTSQVPTIVMAHHNIRNGRDPVPPSETLNHAANFLYMMEGKEPTPETAELMDTDFVLHADHGSNASAFTARTVASTNAHLHDAVTAGIGALSGPSHGGAAENVMTMALEIGEPENAEKYVKDLLARGGRVMGFGHRVYRAEDPRARHLREGVRKLSAEKGEPKWYAILEAVQKAMSPYARRGIHVNVDFFAGVIYYLNGIPHDLFVPIFAVGRIPGWTVQVIEQFEHNILLRPLLQYAGPKERSYTPISER